MRRILNNAISLIVVVIVLFLVIPLHPSVLDVLLILNISLSIMILMITMNISEPLEFSIFPSAGPGHVHAPGSIPAAAVSRPPGGTDRHRGRNAKPAAGRSQRPSPPKRRRRISSESFTLRRIQRSSTSACEARGIRHPGTVSRTRSESM